MSSLTDQHKDASKVGKACYEAIELLEYALYGGDSMKVRHLYKRLAEASFLWSAEEIKDIRERIQDREDDSL